MSQLLTVSRAAQLVGVARAVLQRMIRSGELASFDGLVSTDELLRVFPEVRLEDRGVFEKVARIREEAFGRRLRERMLPSAEVLAQRLFAQSQELAELRRHLQAYHRLLTDALERARDPDAVPISVEALCGLLEQGLARVLGSEPLDHVEAMADMLKVVSANVSVRPSGREFLVEGNDSILQAGLKAGLSFSYGCGGGNCGLCKARLVSGSTREVLHSDYRLSAAEQQQGYLLMCAHTALEDLVIETLEAAGPDDIPEQQIPARVRSVSALGEHTRLLHLQTPRTNRLRFLAGQGVTLGSAIDGEDAHATYPLASCPCDDRNLLFHIAREPDDAFARLVFEDRLRSGAEVNLRGPIGDFVLNAQSERPLVFLTCDTGFAPVKSLIEHAIAVESSEALSLYWLATRADGHYLANQCAAWADALDQFEFVAMTDTEPERGAVQLVDRLAAAGDLGGKDVYVAGPGPFVAALERLLNERAFAPERLCVLAV